MKAIYYLAPVEELEGEEVTFSSYGDTVISGSINTHDSMNEREIHIEVGAKLSDKDLVRHLRNLADAIESDPHHLTYFVDVQKYLSSPEGKKLLEEQERQRKEPPPVELPY